MAICKREKIPKIGAKDVHTNDEYLGKRVWAHLVLFNLILASLVVVKNVMVVTGDIGIKAGGSLFERLFNVLVELEVDQLGLRKAVERRGGAAMVDRVFEEALDDKLGAPARWGGVHH